MENLISDWVNVKVLGRGSHGIVFLATPTTTAKRDLGYVAIKVAVHESAVSSLINENIVLKNFIACQEIVQCIGSQKTVEGNYVNYKLIFEYASGGSLRDLIEKRKKLSEKEVKEYLIMILKGLSCIHGKGFVHCDLKPANILVFPQKYGKIKLKIADFGLSKRYEDEEEEKEKEKEKHFDSNNHEQKLRGTPGYMSPEYVAYGEIKPPCDIWSLGCILLNMISGKRTWECCKNYQELMSKLVYEMKTPEIPKALSKGGKDFLEKCFERNPKRRWTADMLLRHHYLEEEDMKKSVGIQPITTQLWALPQLFSIDELHSFLLPCS